MSDCQFCKIISGESPAEIIYRNRYAVAILDINPIHYGHALVMPKVHYETFLDVPDEMLPDLIKAVKIVSQAVAASLSPEGFNIFSNNGKAAGQSVNHFHFHVTPRYLDDDIQFILKLKKYSDNQMSEYADRLRRHIATNESADSL